MNKKELKLAVSFLQEASHEYNSHCCNDWEFPSNWSKKEKIQFVKEYHQYNGDPEEFNLKHLYLPDFAAMSFLAHKLEKLANTAKKFDS